MIALRRVPTTEEIKLAPNHLMPFQVKWYPPNYILKDDWLKLGDAAISVTKVTRHEGGINVEAQGAG